MGSEYTPTDAVKRFLTDFRRLTKRSPELHDDWDYGRPTVVCASSRYGGSCPSHSIRVRMLAMPFKLLLTSVLRLEARFFNLKML